MKKMKLLKILSLTIISLYSTFLFSAVVKIGLLAPEGTTWADNFKKMGKEIEGATNGAVKLKFYFGGSQGDEREVLRKIKIGQLHGGMFTGKTLGDVFGDARVLEVPFTFGGDREKAFKVMNKLAPYLQKGFLQNGFQSIGFLEIGLVYYVSKVKTTSLKDLKGVKIWAWDGDPVAAALVEPMKLVSVPLPLPDVLSSLSTGVIDGAYCPPMTIIALQWSSKIKYLVDFPITYSIGSFLIDNRAWESSIPKEHRQAFLSISKKYIDMSNVSIVKENDEALVALKNMGVEIVKFPAGDMKEARGHREAVVKALRGKVISDAAFQLIQKEL